MALLPYIVAIVVAVGSAVLYSASNLLVLLATNSPGQLQAINNFRSHEVLFPDVIRNCEDAILDDEGGFMILSCDPGRDTWNTVMGTFVNATAPADTGLYYFDHASAVTARPEKLKLVDFKPAATEFHPLGIEYHAESKRLFVLNMASSGPKLEVFQLLARDRAATHLATLSHPLLVSPNSIAAVKGDELFITNDHYVPATKSVLLSKLETVLALPIANLVYLKLTPSATGIETAKSVARLSFGNGIVELNATTLAVAALTRATVEIYDIDRSGAGAPSLVHKHSVKVPFLPDNLSRDGAGKLLIAGHPFPLGLDPIAANQYRCHDPATAATDSRCNFDRLSAVAEWSEKDGVRMLFSDKEIYGTSTTAVRDAKTGTGYIVGLYAKGFLRFKD